MREALQHPAPLWITWDKLIEKTGHRHRAPRHPCRERLDWVGRTTGWGACERGSGDGRKGQGEMRGDGVSIWRNWRGGWCDMASVWWVCGPRHFDLAGSWGALVSPWNHPRYLMDHHQVT